MDLATLIKPMLTGRRAARHRLDDVRGVQAHREGPRARAAAAEDRDRRAVGRGGDPDSRAGLKSRYEEHHRVTYTDAALEAAVKLAARHLRDYRLPDSAIDLLDEAGSVARLGGRPPAAPADPADPGLPAILPTAQPP